MAQHRFTTNPNWLRMEAVADGIFHVWEPCYRDDYRCNIYVIRGRDCDIVIDTGLGLASLRAFLEPLAPDLLLVSSHAHYDHVGGNFEFRRRVIHPAEAAIVAAPTLLNTYADLLLAAEDFYTLPWERFQAQDWVVEPAPATGLIDEGDILELGDRRLTVLHTPGHSWGSVCLWDEADGSLFCADTVYQGEIFDQLPCSDIPTYVQTMRRLREFPVRVAYPGHGAVLSGDEFKAIVSAYLDTHGG